MLERSVPITSTTQILRLQKIQNAVLWVATGSTTDTNIHHPHDKTKAQLLLNHMQLQASQLRLKATAPELNDKSTHYHRNKKQTTFNKTTTPNSRLQRRHNTNCTEIK